jgi:hypothetical protein
MLLLKILIFVWILGLADLQIGLNIAKAWLALLILAFISCLQALSVVILGQGCTQCRSQGTD